MRIIAGKYRGKKLLSPQNSGVRPTADRARESVFNILNSKLENPWPEYRLLDVFTGTGAFGLEAVSRGVGEVCLIDINPQTAKANAALFPQEKDKIKIITANACRLGAAVQKYNLAFMDAPYNKGLSEQALEQLHHKGWLEKGALCLVEVENKEQIDIPEAYAQVDERVYGLAKIIFLEYQA